MKKIKPSKKGRQSSREIKAETMSAQDFKFGLSYVIRISKFLMVSRTSAELKVT